MRLYLFLADLVLIVHMSFVAFMVLGLLAIWLGWWRDWDWVRDWRFRGAHLIGMAVVTLQAIFQKWCPLTLLEGWLREQGGDGGWYADQTFMQHWLHQVLFFRAPMWVFAVAYSLFFAVLLLSVWVVKPRWPRRHE